LCTWVFNLFQKRKKKKKERREKKEEKREKRKKVLSWDPGGHYQTTKRDMRIVTPAEWT
ncbi:hypothetical protein THAOC_10659, partial [Thalassiosira oceanica]